MAKKPARDPGAPKRNMSAYFLYFNAMRDQVQALNPGITFGQLAKYTAAMYSELPPTEKEAWVARAEADKARYLLELASYIPPPGYDPKGDDDDDAQGGGGDAQGGDDDDDDAQGGGDGTGGRDDTDDTDDTDDDDAEVLQEVLCVSTNQSGNEKVTVTMPPPRSPSTTSSNATPTASGSRANAIGRVVKRKVIIKLQLAGDAGEDGVYRRIQLPLTRNPYRALKNQAIRFAAGLDDDEDDPGRAAAAASQQEFSVRFLYTDVDGDRVMIGSSSELIDAMRQYVDTGSLKVVADVQKKGEEADRGRTSATAGTQTPPPTPPPPPAAGAGRGRCRRSLSPGRDAPVDMLHVAESIVGILATAAIALQGHMHQVQTPPPSGGSAAAVPTRNPTPPPPAATTEPSDSAQATAEAPAQQGSPEPAETEEAAQPEAKVPGDDKSDVAIAVPVVPAEPLKEVAVSRKKDAPASKAEGAKKETPAVESSAPEPRTEDAPTSAATSPETVPSAKPSPEQSKEAPKTSEVVEEVPFIHGRHTCDGCLDTPIVGKRFHATNLRDYDLCEKCFLNYEGKDIKFVEASLAAVEGPVPGGTSMSASDREREVKEQKEKFLIFTRILTLYLEKKDKAMHFRVKAIIKDCAERNRRQEKGYESVTASMRKHLREAVGDNYWKRAEAYLQHFLQQRATTAGASSSSTSSVLPSSTPAPTPVSTSQPVPQPSLVTSTSPLEKTKGPSSSEAERAKAEAEKIRQSRQLVASGATSEGAKSIDDVEHVVEQTSDEEKKSLREVMEEDPKDASDFNSKSETHEEGAEAAKNNDVAEKDPSVDEPKESKEQDDASEKTEVSKQSKCSSKENAAEGTVATAVSSIEALESFAQAAEGSGDVAVSIGVTLDKVAEAIEAMSQPDEDPVVETKSDADENESQVIVTDGDDDDSVLVEEDEDEIVVEEDQDDEDDIVIETSNAEGNAEEHADGVTIVSEAPTSVTNFAASTQGGLTLEGGISIASVGAGAEEAHVETTVEGESDHVVASDSWSVVCEEEQIAGVDDLAQTAACIGSALYNSDMARSAEKVSTLTRSLESNTNSADSSSSAISFDIISSVPSTLPSVTTRAQIPVAQLERWGHQLAQLHEMGFYDDTRYIAILERLNAANIGVGSDEEVSAEHVLDRLFNAEWY